VESQRGNKHNERKATIPEAEKVPSDWKGISYTGGGRPEEKIMKKRSQWDVTKGARRDGAIN